MMPTSNRSRLAAIFGLGSFGVAAVLGVGCDDLPPFELDTCGNGIVERGIGEECDTFVEANDVDFAERCAAAIADAGVEGLEGCELACAGVDEVSSCQYVWGEPTDTESKLFRLCPAGFGKGADGVCHRPSGYFESAPFATIASSGFDGVADDLDGDSRPDLVVTTETQFVGPHMSYIGEGGTVVGPIPLPAAPAVGQISDDRIYRKEIGDLVFPIESTLVTLRGGPGPTFNPKAYVPFPLDGPISIPGFEAAGDRVVLAVEAPEGFDQPYLAVDVEGDLGFFEVSLVSFSEQPRKFLIPNLSLADLREPAGLLTMEFSEAPGAEVIYATDTSVNVISPSTVAPTNVKVPPVQLTPLSVSMKPATVILRLMPVANWPSPAVAALVQTGVGDSPVPEIALIEPGPPPAQMSDPPNPPTVRYLALGTSDVDSFDVLAAGDIDGDGNLDVVTSSRVAFLEHGTPIVPGGTAPVLSARIAATNNVGLWTAARIADLNGSGRMSVVALPGSSGVDVLLPGNAYAMNPVWLDTGVRSDLVEVADYDGDSVGDILVATEPEPPTDAGGLDSCSLPDNPQFPANDDILIAFGRPAGAPEDFSLIGSIPGIRRLVSGRLRTETLFDAVADVGLQTWCDPAKLEAKGRAGIILGSTDRSVYSPYLPYNGPCERRSRIVRAEIGEIVTTPDEEQPHDDLALLALRQPKLGADVATFRYEVTPVLGAGDAELGDVDEGQKMAGCPDPVVASIPVGDPTPRDYSELQYNVPALLVVDLLPKVGLDETLTVTTYGAASTAVLSLVGSDGSVEEHTFETGMTAYASAAKLRAVDVDVGSDDDDLDVVVVMTFLTDGGQVTKAWLFVDDPVSATHLSGPIALSLGGGVGVGPDVAETPVRDVVELTLSPLCPDQSGIDPKDRRECDPTRTLLLTGAYESSICGGISADGTPSADPSCWPALSRNDFGFDTVLGTVVADFDGDGLEDVALLGEQTITLHHQCAFSEVFSDACGGLSGVSQTPGGTGVRGAP